LFVATRVCLIMLVATRDCFSQRRHHTFQPIAATARDMQYGIQTACKKRTFQPLTAALTQPRTAPTRTGSGFTHVLTFRLMITSARWLVFLIS
jgi:hypothetical protein